MRRCGILLCVTALLISLCGCATAPAVTSAVGATVYDAAGAVMGTPKQLVSDGEDLTDPVYSSYMDVVLIEAVMALAEAKDITTTEAQRILFRDGYSIYTALDTVALAALKTGYGSCATDGLTFAAAITDYSGHLLATYSVGEQNYALTSLSPHSSFKPLSVYAPALEKGLINWSTRIIDKPYTRVEGANGQMTDWPRNANGTYTYEKTSLSECIRQSLNTTAVQVLSQLGVDTSIRFLQNTFGIPLTYEQKTMQTMGEDEVIGNIALGSLQTGVTPIEMAGYYQIFGNGGAYTEPHAVLEIRNAAGETVYTAAPETKQAIKPETANIMNHLLQGVVMPGGTGDQARLGNVPVAGKTGTGDRSEENWFVGVTPQYSCSVYHGSCSEGNVADALFASIMEQMPPHTVTEFPSCAKVHKALFCGESGKLFTTGCQQMDVGYYTADNCPERCDGH